MIDQTISHYKILEKLGEGGMGVVYKAEDTKLKRTVALKFLSSQSLGTPEEKTRFVHEAQAAAALDHPNICTVHEIDEADGRTFIAMAYIDGQSLRAKTERGPLKLEKALSVAIDVAQGLQEAHEKGIVHRDIKSANVMVTTKGQAKITDFGLAKLAGSTRLTKTGTSVGTAAYMSPEQARGEDVDQRTDIWSLGVVLYEMLTGRLPFRGEHEQAVTYQIVNEDAEPITALRTGVPTEMDRIVGKCLRKKSNDRYQHMDDMLADLRVLKREVESDASLVQPSPTPSPSLRAPAKRMSVTAIGLLAVVLLAGSLAVALYLKRSGADAPSLLKATLTKITFAPGLEDEPALSPDGKFVAYTTDQKGNLDIVVQPLDGGQPIWVLATRADEAQPRWSPDGRTLAFVSAKDRGGRLSAMLGLGALTQFLNGQDGDIYLVPALGGTPKKLVEDGYYPDWSPDGQHIVFQSVRNDQSDIWVVAVAGGAPRQLTDDLVPDYHPAWSPDGQWIAYCKAGALHVMPAAGGEFIELLPPTAMVLNPRWSSDGRHIFYSSNQSGRVNIWRMPFAPTEPDVGSSVRVTMGEGHDLCVSVAGTGDRIAFSTVQNTPNIFEFTLSSGSLRQVTFETGREDYPHLSPDGKTLLLLSDRGGAMALWTADLEGNMLAQHSQPGEQVFAPRWSPDGTRVLYTIAIGEPGGGGNRVVVKSLGDVGVEEIPIMRGNVAVWSPDGSKLARSLYDESGQAQEIGIHSFDTGQNVSITTLGLYSNFPTWSPDGRRIAFSVNEQGTRHLWIVPADGGEPQRLTTGDMEHSHPQWSPRDPDAIMFVRNHKNICLVSVSTGKVRQLTEFEEANLVVDYPSWAFDGDRIYFSVAKKLGDVYVLGDL